MERLLVVVGPSQVAARMVLAGTLEEMEVAVFFACVSTPRSECLEELSPLLRVSLCCVSRPGHCKHRSR